MTAQTYTDALTDDQCVEICQRLPLGCAGFVSVEAIRYALAPLLTERQAAMQGQRGEVIELPDNIRVPLDEVIADLGYLFGRVAADESFMKAAMDSTRLKLESARKAIVAALQPPQPVRSVSEEDVRYAERYRWLRGRNVGDGRLYNVIHDDAHPGYQGFKYEEELDQAIDAAIDTMHNSAREVGE